MSSLEIGALVEEGSAFSVKPDLVVTGRTCVIGSSGSGKSYAVGVICEELCRSEVPFVIIDTEGEYSGLKEKFELMWVADEGECDLKWADVDLSNLAASVLDGPPLILDMSGVDKPREKVGTFLTKVYEEISKRRRPYLVILEEADRFIPQAGERVPIFGEIARRGRKRGLGLMICTQRPSLVDKNILSQCANQLIGKLVINNDLESVAQFFPNRTILKQLTTLAPGQFFASGGFTQSPELITTRKRVTRHGGITPQLASTVSGRPHQSLAKVMTALQTKRQDPDSQSESSTPGKLGFEPAIPLDRVPLFIKRKKSHKLFGQEENLVSVKLTFRPLIEAALRARVGRISKKFVTSTFIIDGETGRSAKLSDNLEFGEGLERFLGLHTLDIEILKSLDASKDTSILDLSARVKVSEDIARKSLKALEEARLIQSAKVGRTKLYRRLVDLPKLDLNRDGTFLELSEIHPPQSSEFIEPKIPEEKLRQVIKGIMPDSEIEKFRIFYYPSYRAELSLEGRIREVYVDARSGKTF
ncbi:MAG: helicase HerA domain-containing protein [Nitrososphaerales archaeon]